VRAIDALFILAEEYGAEVVGVRYPTTNGYQQYARSYNINSVRSALATYPFKAMLDYEQLFSDRQELFQDGDHLNALGASIFKKLLDDLSRLL